VHFFVTGATGFLGSQFVKRALSLNHEVTALSRFNSFQRIKLSKQPKWCVGTLSDNWTRDLSSCDTLVHFAAEGVIDNFDNWERCFDINFVQFQNLIKNAFNVGIKKFLICGSCFEYGKSGDLYEKIPTYAELKPIGAYASSKAAAGLAALEFAKRKKLNLILARVFHVYGEGENPKRFWPSLVEAALNGSDFKMTLGEQKRNFTRVDQMISMLIDLCFDLESIPKGGVIRNLGSSNNSSLKNFAINEWERLGATGAIKFGELPYKKNEVMSYVPLLETLY
tara:strand:- start:187 stop:1029 length:843 start_codon:yes stop_codon:yes gene_type:complete